MDSDASEDYDEESELLYRIMNGEQVTAEEIVNVVSSPGYERKKFSSRWLVPLAQFEDNIPIIRQLCQKHKFDVNEAGWHIGMAIDITPLSVAVRYRLKAMVLFLIYELGAKMLVSSQQKISPLLLACSLGLNDMIRLLCIELGNKLEIDLAVVRPCIKVAFNRRQESTIDMLLSDEFRSVVTDLELNRGSNFMAEALFAGVSLDLIRKIDKRDPTLLFRRGNPDWPKNAYAFEMIGSTSYFDKEEQRDCITRILDYILSEHSLDDVTLCRIVLSYCHLPLVLEWLLPRVPTDFSFEDASVRLTPLHHVLSAQNGHIEDQIESCRLLCEHYSIPAHSTFIQEQINSVSALDIAVDMRSIDLVKLFCSFGVPFNPSNIVRKTSSVIERFLVDHQHRRAILVMVVGRNSSTKGWKLTARSNALGMIPIELFRSVLKLLCG